MAKELGRFQRSGVDVIEPLRNGAACSYHAFVSRAHSDKAEEEVWQNFRWQSVISKVEDVEQQEERVAVVVCEMYQPRLIWLWRWRCVAVRGREEIAEDGAREAEGG